MSSGRLTRQIALFAGGVAIVGMGALTACSNSEKEAPSTTTPSSVSVTPTEKAVAPGGPNSFSPTVNPAPPGPVCKQVVGNDCVR
ncbi:hypothetical protein B1R94_15110 [Mycolicibacterium litorale]|nr:hypothetical protein B1R94_15110 [Mycolicibacterium litorale]